MSRRVYDTDDIAGYRTQEGQRPLQLWAGDAKIITDVFQKANAGDTFAKYEVVSINDSGSVIKFDPNAAAGTSAAIPRGFIAQPVDEATVWTQVFIGGYPNHEALIWPPQLDTFEKRRYSFLDNGALFIGKLNGPQPA